MARVDPYGGYNFAVELDGITRAGFRDASGLGSTQNVTSYREGTDKQLGPRKQPGLNTHSDVTLSRGLTSDNSLWEWRRKAASGAVERHTISIRLLDDAGNAKIIWNLFDAWPSSWTGPSFAASSDEIAVEQLTIAYERIEVDQWS